MALFFSEKWNIKIKRSHIGRAIKDSEELLDLSENLQKVKRLPKGTEIEFIKELYGECIVRSSLSPFIMKIIQEIAREFVLQKNMPVLSLVLNLANIGSVGGRKFTV